MAKVHADRARRLVGTRFRPQGRDAAHGLDCLGLAALVYRASPWDVPADYRLRGDHRERMLDGLARRFRALVRGNVTQGDLLLLQVADDQMHLAVVTAGGFVHADARVGRVVETPGAPPWPVVRAFRARRKVEG